MPIRCAVRITAGLMAELGKIRRVLGKLDAGTPHEVLMVIDGTTGQNAISQLRAFHQAVNVTGLVVTKLDGSAKGGVLFALAAPLMARADDWAAPRTREVFSASREWFVRVTPGGKRATAEFYRRAADRCPGAAMFPCA